ncbi:bola domain-containing protein [Lophium mytilinum]|uniref:Bola domain-containing protein n=1 Tax=Lophium mytilinum TaxID=390894 RepID=A0A6A6QT04_9PEZI|nr:bola domain-containing protein [Lophium mytilinum]
MDPRLPQTLSNLHINESTPATMASTSGELAETQRITPEVLKSKLIEKLEATHVEIDDKDGCGQMIEAIIVSPQFTKKTTLARHRLVNAALKEEIAAIHAWSPKCHTPEEWEKKKPQA